MGHMEPFRPQLMISSTLVTMNSAPFLPFTSMSSSFAAALRNFTGDRKAGMASKHNRFARTAATASSSGTCVSAMRTLAFSHLLSAC